MSRWGASEGGAPRATEPEAMRETDRDGHRRRRVRRSAPHRRRAAAGLRRHRRRWRQRPRTSAPAKAEALGIAKRAYGSYEALLDDPDVQVVHNATPNYLHYPVNAAAIAKGKHIVSDKPLAMTAAEARSAARSGDEGRRRPRGDVQLSRQPARAAGAARDRARRHRQAALPARLLPAGLAAQGHRLLVAARAGQGRRVVGARRHRIALVRSGGARERAAHHARARRHHDGDPKRKRPKGRARGVPGGGRERGGRARRHRGRGSRVGAAALRQRREGQSSRSGRSAPGTRTISCSRSAGRRRRSRWRQEHQNELWIGHRDKANEVLQKDPSLHRRRRPRATRTCRAAIRRRGRTRSAT